MMINIDTISSYNIDENIIDKWDVIYIGTSVDHRGEKAIQTLNRHCNNIQTVEYSHINRSITINNREYVAQQIKSQLNIQYKKVLFETTTMGFTEILLLTKQLLHSNEFIEIDYLYLEPKSYAREQSDILISNRDFSLTDEVEGYFAVPGYASLFRNNLTKTVFLLGYEGQRLEMAIEQQNVIPDECFYIFGVPAFKPGWEMNSFANNVKVLKDRNQYMSNVLYAGANNPFSVYECLDEIYSSLNNGEKLHICPIGTKPHAIGALIYCCFNNNISLMFDYPKKKEGRSLDSSRIHIYKLRVL